MENPMPRISSRWRLALAVSGLALLAACTPYHPMQQSTYVAPEPTTVPEPTVVPVQSPMPVSTSNVMTTSSGMTVYVYDRDTAGHSTCYDTCAEYWPPVYAPAGAVPTGGLALITRGDGRVQWATSDGKPLYTFVNDRVPGDIHGNNIDGSWHILAADYGSTYIPYGSTYVPYGSTTYVPYRSATYVPYGSTTSVSYGSTSAPYGSGYRDPTLRTVSADGAAVTVQPGNNSAIITVVNAGAQVRMIDTNGEWSHVEANGQDGFIRTSALR
jgi:predicted lipoprotein with Yx(FWY)xxD motif